MREPIAKQPSRAGKLYLLKFRYIGYGVFLQAIFVTVFGIAQGIRSYSFYFACLIFIVVTYFTGRNFQKAVTIMNDMIDEIRELREGTRKIQSIVSARVAFIRPNEEDEDLDEEEEETYRHH